MHALSNTASSCNRVPRQHLKLSWRIPTSGDPRILRLALAQIGLASIVAGLVLAATMPPEWLAPGLAGLVPLAIYMAYRRWKRYQDSMAGENNVRIDDAGLHWLNAAGQEQSLSRAQTTGFSIGRDRDTLRPVPALTLYLHGGLESQPLELHPPATVDAVRHVLIEDWGLGERDLGEDERAAYDFAAHVYSECHEDFHEWHWEGTREELTRFFALIAAAGEELPPPGPGVKPAQRIILANRREQTRLIIAHGPRADFDHDMLAAPASVLRSIASSALAILENTRAQTDLKFDVPLAPRNRWTFHLHVMVE